METQMQESVVCVLSVDTRYGCDGELMRKYYSYKEPAVAELFAGKYAQQMEDEGFHTTLRGVFVKRDGDWKTVRSYFHVGA